MLHTGTAGGQGHREQLGTRPAPDIMQIPTPGETSVGHVKGTFEMARDLENVQRGVVSAPEKAMPLGVRADLEREARGDEVMGGVRERALEESADSQPEQELDE